MQSVCSTVISSGSPPVFHECTSYTMPIHVCLDCLLVLNLAFLLRNTLYIVCAREKCCKCVSTNHPKLTTVLSLSFVHMQCFGTCSVDSILCTLGHSLFLSSLQFWCRSYWSVHCSPYCAGAANAGGSHRYIPDYQNTAYSETSHGSNTGKFVNEYCNMMCKGRYISIVY